MAYCPRCQQPLPDPPDRYCPHCGADTQALPPAGVPLPPAGVPPDVLAPLPPDAGGPETGPPWERRDRIGFLSALVETVQQVLTAPTRFFQSMPVTGGIGGPLLFGVIVGYIGTAAGAIYNAVLGGMLGSGFRFGNPELDRYTPYLFQSGAGLIVSLIFGPVGVVISLFVASGIYHLMLLVVGGAQRGFEATFRVVAYSFSAVLIEIVPFCGSLIGRVYFLVLAIIGLAEAHRISRGKSSAAVLLPLLLLCCCCVLLVVILAGGVARLLQSAH
jgi:hypothetical protein